MMFTAPATMAQSAAADHHQHLFSPAIASLMSRPGATIAPLDAADIMPLLDVAGIRQAVLLSVAYVYGAPSRSFEDEYARVRSDNDWTGAQAARFPGRLIAFCSVNPLKNYALQEIARCAKHPDLRRGLKLHFGNSDVRLELPEHIERLRKVFAAANQNGMALAVHMRASISRKRPYGADQARAFLERVLPAAPDVPVQVAHLAGSGPGYEDREAHQAMAVLAGARHAGDLRTRNLWVDVASSVDAGISPAAAALVVRRIREFGVDHVLYGSDAAVGVNLRPREAWAAFRTLPLTQQEFRRIAGNVAPYFE